MRMTILLFLLVSANPALAASEIERLTHYDVDTSNVTSYVERDFETYTRSLRIMRRPFYDDVPFYLAVPKDMPLKGIIFLLHGITSSKDIWWQGEGPYSKLSDYRKGLLEAGYIVVAPDAKYHGQRSAQVGFESPMTILSGQKWLKMQDLLTGSVKDFRALIDYTSAEYPELPTGVLGMSLGALQTLILGSVESRLDFIVPIFPPIQKVAASLESVHPFQLASTIGIPTLLLISDRDIWYRFEDGKKLYGKLASDNKKLLVLETPHELLYSESSKVVSWIKNIWE